MKRRTGWGISRIVNGGRDRARLGEDAGGGRWGILRCRSTLGSEKRCSWDGNAG